jgi:hypothetical protein
MDGMFRLVVMIGGTSTVVVVVPFGPGVVVVASTGVPVVVVVTSGGTTVVVVVTTGGTTVVVVVVAVSGGTVVVVVVGVVVVTGGAQVGIVTVFVSRVTAPLIANSRPSTVASVVAVMSVSANRFPRKTELVPRVAELPTCQKTLHACVPLISATVLDDDVISVDPAWKTKTASGSPCASRVTVPDSAIDEPEL